MQFIDRKTIKLDKVENQLDRFVLDFLKILKRHAKYVVISGYVSILFGRTRGTEDIDIFIERLDKKKTDAMHTELLKHYSCLNTDDVEEIYGHLQDGLALRFALKNTVIPNFEIKFAKRKGDLAALDKPLKVILPSGEILTSPIEQQIAYKRFFLGSDKDIEDANHLQKIFEGHLDNSLILKFKNIIEKSGI